MFPDLSLPEAAALAIVLAATDAALGQAVVTDARLPASIRQGLNVESGLNDGLCVPAADHRADARGRERRRALRSEAARVIAESIGYGVLMGVVAGVVAALVHRRATTAGDEEQADWRFLLTLVAPALAYGLAAPLDGSGFIAAFVAGLRLRHHARPAPRHRAAPRRGDRRDAQRRDVRRVRRGLPAAADRARDVVGRALRAAEPDRRADAAGGDRDARHRREPGRPSPIWAGSARAGWRRSCSR